MADSLGDVIVGVGADTSDFTDTVKSDVEKTSKNIGAQGEAAGKSFSKKLAAGAVIAGTAGKKLTKSVSLPLIAVGVLAIKAADKVSDAHDQIAIATGATGKDLKGLNKVFDNVTKAIPVPFDTAAKAIGNLQTLTGATGPVLEKLTKNVLEASRVLGEDGAANAALFGKSLNQWNIPAKDADKNLESLFVATQKYGTGLGETINLLNQYGPILQNAGFSMTESADLFGQLEKAGLSVSRLMPGLNAAFRKWAEEQKDPQKELKKTFDAMTNASSGAEALSLASTAFGAEGAQRLTTAVRSGALSLDDLGAALQNTGPDILETGKKTQTMGDKMEVMKNNATQAFGKLGEKLLPVVTAAMSKLTDGIQAALKWWESLPGGVQQTLKIFAGLVAVIGPLLVGFSKFIELFKVFSALSKASVIGLIVVAIAALAAGLIYAYQHSEAFRDIVDAVFTFIKDVVSAVVNWFTGSFIPFFTVTIPNAWSTAWGWVKDKIRDIAVAVINLVQGIVDWFNNTFIPFFTVTIPGIWSSAWGWVKEHVSEFGQWFVDKWDWIVKKFSSIFGGIKKIAKDIWDGVVSKFKDGINAVTGFINTYFIHPINTVTGVFGIPPIDDIPPWLESGGVVGLASGGAMDFSQVGAGFKTKGPKAIVGEGNPNYPEVVIPTDPKYRANARRLMTFASGKIPMYAAGGQLGGGSVQTLEGGGILGFLGKVASGALDLLKKVGSTLKDWTEAALDLLKQGVAAAMKAVVDPIIDKVKQMLPSGFLGDWMRGIIDTVYGGIKNLLGIKHKELEDASGKADKNLSSSAPGGGAGVEKWRGVALNALAAAGQPASWIDKLLMQMNSESGGNPQAINNWDSNAQKGTPSKGLMQTIDSTFQAYAGPYASRGVYDPFANIYAAIKYTLSAYGSLGIWHGKGYDQGGMLGTGMTLANNRSGKPEAVLTARQNGTLQAIANGEGGSQYGDIYVTLSIDDLDKINKMDDFLKMMDEARVNRRRTERSGTVRA